MAGFLDARERVIDLVLTDQGKQLLLRGALRFAYWIPFDDEINYQPTVTIHNASEYQSDPQALAQLIADASRSMIEDPVIREATMGYRGLNPVEQDTTNVYRPMYTSIPGIGHLTPLPQMVVSDTGSLDVQITQTHIRQRQVKRDSSGNVVASAVVDVGYQRQADSAAYVSMDYSTGSFTVDKSFEGFLVTVYQNVSGNLQEIVHNRSSDGNVVYRNDITLDIENR